DGGGVLLEDAGVEEAEERLPQALLDDCIGGPAGPGDDLVVALDRAAGADDDHCRGERVGLRCPLDPRREIRAQAGPDRAVAGAGRRHGRVEAAGRRVARARAVALLAPRELDPAEWRLAGLPGAEEDVERAH